MVDPVLVPAATATVQRAPETAAERRARYQREELLAVLNTEAGQAFVWRLMEHGHLHQAVLSTGTEFQRGIAEGERRVALWLMSIITEVDPAGVATLMVAAGRRDAQRDQEDLAIAADTAKKAAEESSRLNLWDRAWRSISGQRPKAS